MRETSKSEDSVDERDLKFLDNFEIISSHAIKTTPRKLTFPFSPPTLFLLLRINGIYSSSSLELTIFLY